MLVQMLAQLCRECVCALFFFGVGDAVCVGLSADAVLPVQHIPNPRGDRHTLFFRTNIPSPSGGALSGIRAMFCPHGAGEKKHHWQSVNLHRDDSDSELSVKSIKKQPQFAVFSAPLFLGFLWLAWVTQVAREWRSNCRWRNG